jgi:hypothetical protein
MEKVIVAGDAFNMDISKNKFEKFTMNVVNGTASSQKVALLRAFYETRKVAMIGAAGSEVATLVKNDISELVKNGFPVVAVAHDGTTIVDKAASKGVAFSSSNSAVSIDSFLSYLLTNPRKLKEMTIVVNDQNALSSDLELTIASPLGHGKTINVELMQFFSQFQNQNDRITIDFSKNELEFSDVLVMCLNIAPNSSMQLTFRF